MIKLKKFKVKECKNVFCKALQLLLFHKLTQILFGVGLILIGIIGFNITPEDTFINNLFSIIFVVGLGILAVFVLIMIAYAWIINPIRNKKKK